MMQNPEGKQLRGIRNARNWLIVCFLTFPLYAMGIAGTLNAGNGITGFMLIYMAIYAAFGINASLRQCPGCGEQFFVRTWFLNPLRTRCAHCGLSMRTGRTD